MSVSLSIFRGQTLLYVERNKARMTLSSVRLALRTCPPPNGVESPCLPVSFWVDAAAMAEPQPPICP